MYFKILLLVLLLITTEVYPQKSYYNINDYISETGKSKLITVQLQELIDECSLNGGGYIQFPAGEYLTGTIVLKDNTYLDLSPGATLYGSKDINDYTHGSLIYSNGASNIGIIGKGSINGQGDFFWRGKKRPYNRPGCMIQLENSTDIKIKDINILNSPSWNIALRFCNRVWINGISMISDHDSPNSDGIDPISSKNVFISNCYIDVGDDAICLKTMGDVTTENIVVDNCVLISDDSAIKFGTGSDTHIRNAVFSNIIIRNTAYGIGLYAKDGGTYENIRFSNIHIETIVNDNNEDVKTRDTYPIYIDLEKRSSDSKLGYVKNIFFDNITIDTYDGHCLFLGQPNHKFENINLSNINYTLHHRRSFEGKTKPRGTRKLKIKAANDFADVPAHFTFAHIDGLVIKDLRIIDLSNSDKNERHMIWGYDVHDAQIKDFSNKLIVPNKKLSQLYFNEVSDIEIKNSSPTYSSSPFLYLEGADTRNVILQNNNFYKTNRVVEFDESFKKSELIEFNNLKN